MWMLPVIQLIRAWATTNFIKLYSNTQLSLHQKQKNKNVVKWLDVRSHILRLKHSWNVSFNRIGTFQSTVWREKLQPLPSLGIFHWITLFFSTFSLILLFFGLHKIVDWYCYFCIRFLAWICDIKPTLDFCLLTTFKNKLEMGLYTVVMLDAYHPFIVDQMLEWEVLLLIQL